MKALMIVLLNLSLLALIGCEQRALNQNENTRAKDEVMVALNNRNPDRALELLNDSSVDQNDQEMQYLKASSLSMKAGIDAIALYPILEMKILKESVMNWDVLKKTEKNPYRKYFIIDNTKIDYSNNNMAFKKFKQKTKTIIDQDLGQFKEVKNLKELIELTNQVSTMFFKGQFNLEENEILLVKETLLKYKKNIEDFNVLQKKQEQIKNQDGNEIDGNREIDLDKLEERSSELKEKILLNIKEINNILTLDKQKNEETTSEAVNESPVTVDRKIIDLQFVHSNLMNIIWATYQALPLLSQIPRAQGENKKYIDESMKILSQLEKSSKNKDRNLGWDNSMGKKAGGHLNLLSIIMIINTLKDIVLIEKDMLDPFGLVCRVEAKTIALKFVDLRTYISYFVASAYGVKLDNHFFKELDNLLERMAGSNNEMTEESQVILNNGLNKIKEKYCQ